MPSQMLLAGLGAAVLVGGVHWLAHTLGGDESAFDDAGVVEAGLAVMLVAGVTAWALSSWYRGQFPIAVVTGTEAIGIGMSRDLLQGAVALVATVAVLGIVDRWSE